MGNEKRGRKGSPARGCMSKSTAFVLLALFALYKGCSSCLDESRKRYDDEYWRSVAREKTMREAGLDRFADRERKDRQMEAERKERVKDIARKGIRAKADRGDAGKGAGEESGHGGKAYGIASEGEVYVLDTIGGGRILNEKATEYFGERTYYRIGKGDAVFIIKESGKWVKVRHVKFPQNCGWIEKEHIGKEARKDGKARSRPLNGYNGSEQQKKDLEMIDEYMKGHPDF